MSVKDIQLKGDNICNVECMDKNSILHPESCVNQIKIADDVSVTLDDWLAYNPSDTSTPLGGFDDYNGLLPWLTENYPIPEYIPYQLPTATASVKGGIKVGDYLTIDNERLSVNISSLNIPDTPTFSVKGAVNLGSNSAINATFDNISDYISTGDGSFAFPLKVDAGNHSGIEISKSFFENYNKVSWSRVIDKPSVTNNTLTITYNGTEYSFQSNGNSDTELTINSSSYTQGEGILIDNQTISQSVATNNSIGGIKLGYTETDNRKAVKLDENNEAFVELKKASGAWISNGMSQHYFRTTTATEHYIPLMKIEMPEGYTDSFKINVLFRIVSRHAAHYSGTFYINIKNLSNVSSGAIIASDIVSDKVNTIPYLQPYDIVVSFDNEEQTSATIYRRKLAGTLGNASGEATTSSDVFIVDVLGNNDEDGNNNIINNITYYCTEKFNDNEEVISSFATNITNSEKFNYIYNTGSSSSGVTSITAGIGLSGGTITEAGTIKTKLESETSIGEIGTTQQLYPVGVDINGKLCVSVPWEQPTYTAGSNISINNNVISATNTIYSAGTNVVFSGTTINVPTAKSVFFVELNDFTTSEYMDSLINSIKDAHIGNRTPTVYIDYQLDSSEDDTSLQCLATFLNKLSETRSLSGSRIIIYVIAYNTNRIRVPFRKAFIEHNIVNINGTQYNCSANVAYDSSTSILTVYENTSIKIEVIVSPEIGQPQFAFITTLK